MGGVAGQEEPLTSLRMRSQSRGRIVAVACCTVGLMTACFAGGYHVGLQRAATSDIQTKQAMDMRTASEELLSKFDKNYSDKLEGDELKAMYHYLGVDMPPHMAGAKVSASRIRGMAFEKSFRDALTAKWDGGARRF